MGFYVSPAVIPVIGSFFFSAWIIMIFWGIVAPDMHIPTIGYPKAMIVTIGLWLAVAPFVLATSQRIWGRFSNMRWK